MPTLSLMVAARTDQAARLIRLTRDHADAIAAQLAPILGTSSALSARQTSLFLLAQVAHLERLTQDLEAADLAYSSEQDDDVILRGQIADASVELVLTLDTIRQVILRAETPDTLQLYGLQLEPPRARRALVEYASHAVAMLRAHPYAFAREAQEPWSCAEMIGAIKTHLAPLEQLVTTMNLEMTELQDRLRLRNDLMERWAHTFVAVGTCVEGMCLLAQLDDLADQLKTLRS